MDLDDLPPYGIPQEPPDEWSTGELERLVSEAFKARAKVDELKEELKRHNGRLATINASIQKYLEFFNKTKFQGSDGEIAIRKKHSFKVPKDLKSKHAFFEWLQKKDIFWQYTTVNSRSLNALLNAELEACEQQERNFEVPGIEEATEYNEIVMRRKK